MRTFDLLLARSRDLPKPDRDAAPLEAALQTAGLRARWANWDDPAEDWKDAPQVLIRSTWGYALQVDRYLDWIAHVAARTALSNQAPVVRWNAHKRYLLDLEARGVPVVPTALLPRGEAVDPQALCHARGWKRVVLKPAVSAGSHETHAFGADAIDAITFNRVLTAGDVLIQPYVDSVDGHGERSMVFIDGMLTHAIRKAPRWVGQDESITGPMPISAAERAVAEAAMAVIGEPLLYGRVDLVLDGDGAPRVTELELIEPSLFFDFEPLAAKRLVAALAARL